MRRPQIDPKQLRKHSKIVEKAAEAEVVVAGNRERTDFGYVIEGHTSKAFETKVLTVMPHSMTPKWLHDKKTRVFRVASGIGHYETFTVETETQPAADETSQVSKEVTAVKPVVAGDEVVIEPGTTYRIKSGPNKLELYVIQDSKYEASLQELAPVEKVAEVTEADVQSVIQEDKTHQATITMGTDPSLRRRSNKAREQLAAMRPNQDRSRGGQRVATTEQQFFSSSASSAGINALPVMNFDPDGAG